MLIYLSSPPFCCLSQAMKGGILEVLLASAEGLKDTNLLGKSSYYVIVKCGNHEFRSKTTSGEDRNAVWNEKFTFEFPCSSNWEDIIHLNLKIMEGDHKLSGPSFVGETTVHLGGVITEGNARGFIELKPAPFNVVLEDDTYKGEIRIGFKFIPKVEVAEKKEDDDDQCETQQQEQQPLQPWPHRKMINFQRIPWRWLLFFFKRWNTTSYYI